MNQLALSSTLMPVYSTIVRFCLLTKSANLRQRYLRRHSDVIRRYANADCTARRVWIHETCVLAVGSRCL